MTGSTSSTVASRGEKLAALHAQLTAAVDQLVEAPAWQQMLRIAARLPRYSPSNVLLIAAQRPDATRVMGYRGWSALGRHVIKGEKGIAILAPCLYRTSPDDPHSVDSQAETPIDAAQRVLRGYRVVHVFDITQTDGPPPPDPQLLTGSAPPHLYQRLEKLVTSADFQVLRGDCHGANGYTDFTRRIVTIRGDVDDAQATKTLAHELGHIRAEHQQRFLDPDTRTITCRGIAEVEAESIAYLVVAAAGLDSTAYTVPYLAGWADGDTALVRDTATRVLGIATAIDHDLAPQPMTTGPGARAAVAPPRAYTIQAPVEVEREPPLVLPG